MSILNYDLPVLLDGAPVAHPSWCDPRECRVVDHRPDGLSLLRVHAVTLWQAIGGRRLELFQTETLTDAGDVACTHRPNVRVHGELDGCSFSGPNAAAFGRALVDAGELAAAGSLSVTPSPFDWISERFNGGLS